MLTKLSVVDDAKLSKEALELLGIARERKGQKAHAKAVYQHYLKLYPDGEDSDRVRQRLAELIDSDLKPRDKLKVPEGAPSDKVRYQSFGTLAQYFFYGDNTIEGGSRTDQSLLLTQYSYDWRMQQNSLNVRAYFDADHDYDYYFEEDGGVEVDALYVDVKQGAWGLYGRAGRQTSNGGGILGRFDGVQLGYDILSRLRVNVYSGYPVGFENRSTIQTDTRFSSVSLEWTEIFSNIDFAPYMLRQNKGDLLDREAAGYDLRFFHKRGNFYHTLDYDLAFDSLNLLMLRGQFNFNERHSVNAYYDRRRSPLLELNNALLSRPQAGSVDELLTELDEEALRALALDNTGETRSYSVGYWYNYSDRFQYSLDWSRSSQLFHFLGADGETLESEEDDQTYLSMQLVTGNWLQMRDNYIVNLRYSDTQNYSDWLAMAAMRVSLNKVWRLDLRYAHIVRDDFDDFQLVRRKPTFKLEYNWSKTMQLHLQVGVTWWEYYGDTANQDYIRRNMELGYRWSY